MTSSIMYKYGPQAVIDMVKTMGVTSPLPNSPSLCLGTSDMSVKEITAAYSTFVNNGNYTEPLFITKITDKNGVTLEEFPTETNEVLSDQTAAIMVETIMGEGGIKVIPNWLLKKMRNTSILMELSIKLQK